MFITGGSALVLGDDDMMICLFLVQKQTVLKWWEATQHEAPGAQVGARSGLSFSLSRPTLIATGTRLLRRLPHLGHAIGILAI